MKLLHQYMQMSCSWFSVTLSGVMLLTFQTVCSGLSNWSQRSEASSVCFDMKRLCYSWRDPRLYSHVRHEGKGVKNCMPNWWVDAVGCDAACRWDHTFFQKHRWCNFQDSWSLVARHRKGMSRDLMLYYESARNFNNGVQVSPKRPIWGFFCAIHIVCVCALDSFNQHFCISESNE